MCSYSSQECAKEFSPLDDPQVSQSDFSGLQSGLRRIIYTHFWACQEFEGAPATRPRPFWQKSKKITGRQWPFWGIQGAENILDTLRHYTKTFERFSVHFEPLKCFDCFAEKGVAWFMVAGAPEPPTYPNNSTIILLHSFHNSELIELMHSKASK